MLWFTGPGILAHERQETKLVPYKLVAEASGLADEPFLMIVQCMAQLQAVLFSCVSILLMSPNVRLASVASFPGLKHNWQ